MTSNALLIEDSEPLHEAPKLQLVSSIPSRITEGKDEMNFAEFPLSSLSERPNPSQKTIVFEDVITDKSTNSQIHRKVTITGADAYGLPTPLDEEVLLGLIQLSKLQNFSSKRIYFTRYQLMNLLKWKTTGQNYSRLQQALNRWMGVTMYYKNAWRDRKHKRWLDVSFHVLETVQIVKTKSDQRTPDDELSYFEWNDIVFRSFENGNVKALNYDFFLSIESPIAQRLYRFLDKRFHFEGEKRFDVKTLCYEKIAMSRNTALGDMKRKLNVAIDELEQKGYLEPTPKERRFVKQGPGVWQVSFRKQSRGGRPAIEVSTTKTEPLSLEEALVQYGVREQKAKEIVQKFPKSLIEEKLVVALWMKENKDSRISSNPAGYLIASIENNYDSPRDYKQSVEDKDRKTKTDRALKADDERKKLRAQKQEEEDAAKRRAVEEFLNSLTLEQRDTVEFDAMARAEPGKLKMLTMPGMIGEVAKQMIVQEHVLELLANG